MNREALDEFFAKAEDVLTDWEPTDDAMVARVEDEGADLPVADSYYQQTWLPPIRESSMTWNRNPEGDTADSIYYLPTLNLGEWQRELLEAIYAPLDRDILTGLINGATVPQGIVTVPVVGRSPFDDIRQLQQAIAPPPEPRADWQGPDPLPVILDETCGWRPAGFTADDDPVYFAPLAESPRDRALRLRRERNTGPTDQRGLDGRRRR